MTPRRTIGFVTTSFPRFRGDSAGVFVHGMARALVSQGFHVEVVTPQPPQESAWNTPGESEFDGMTIWEVPYMRPKKWQTLFFGDGVLDNLHNSPSRAALIPFALANLYRTLRHRARHWDAAISHWLVPAGLLTGLALRNRVPHLAIAHSGDVHLLKKIPHGAFWACVIERNADFVGFISRALQDEFSALLPQGSERLAQMPMGYFPEDFSPVRTREELRRALGLTRFTVLFLGRLVPIKGLDVLLRALFGVADVDLIVAGDGAERARMERMAAELKLNARFVGPVGAAGRADLLAACDVLVVPSRVLKNGRHEGLPLTVVEGLAAGIPVIASKTGAIPELITDGVTGLLVSPDDPAGLRRAVVAVAGGEVAADALSREGKIAVASRNWHFLADRALSLLFNH